MQHPLCASTGTKNPNYRDVIVEELIVKDTVNTMPPQTERFSSIIAWCGSA